MTKVVATVSLFAALLAQQTRPVFRAKIDLVQVDVVVVDRDGNPVRGLQAADFTVLDRKHPQTIASFDEVSHERTRAADVASLPAGVRLDVGSNQTAQADRLVILVVDDLHIWKGRTDRAREIASTVLRDLGPQSSMAVLFTSREHSTQVTADRALLHDALATLKGRQSVRRPNTASDNQRSQTGDLQAFSDNMTQYKTLEDAGRMLGAGDARRKAFVVISEGIGKDLTGVFDGEITPCEGLCSSCPCYHDTALRLMMESLRRSNVTSYTVDPRGHISAAQLAQEAFPSPQTLPPNAGSQRPADGMGDDPASGGFRWNNPIRQAQDGLKIMAEASGGFGIVDTDDFASGLRRIIEDLDHYYLLGFYLSDPKGKHYRPLDVRVAGHPDWTIRFRRGYMPGGLPDPPKNTSPLVALSAGVLPKTELPLRLTATTFPGATAGMTRVVLALEVSAPRRTLEGPDRKIRDRLKYEVLVVDQKKAKIRSIVGLEGELTLSPIAPSEHPPETLEYQVGETFELAPGRYELRVSAISAKLTTGGSVYLDLEVPDFRKPPIAVGGLLVARAGGARVPVAPPTVRRTRSATSRTAAAPLPFSASLDRVFTAADDLRVYFEGTARARTGLTAAIELVNAGGKVVRSPSPSFASGDPIRVQGMVPLGGLPPGAYILRGRLGDGSQTATSQTGFVIR